MTSSERISYLVDHDTCNSSVPHFMDECCHGFRAGKLLAASCLHCMNCRLTLPIY